MRRAQCRVANELQVRPVILSWNVITMTLILHLLLVVVSGELVSSSVDKEISLVLCEPIRDKYSIGSTNQKQVFTC